MEDGLVRVLRYANPRCKPRVDVYKTRLVNLEEYIQDLQMGYEGKKDSYKERVDARRKNRLAIVDVEACVLGGDRHRASLVSLETQGRYVNDVDAGNGNERGVTALESQVRWWEIFSGLLPMSSWDYKDAV